MRHDKALTPLAQSLRKNMTRAERKLWYEFLRHYPKQFRRQLAIDRYILDFYCASAQLAVEVDGGQHYSPSGLARDAERTAFLEGAGISVLRFSNLDVVRNFPDVCMEIDRAVKARTRAFPFGEGGSPQG